MINELDPSTFDSYAEITEEIFNRAKYDRPFNREHFVSTWKLWMSFGFAKTWATSDAIIGAIINEDVFTGTKSLSIVFWHARSGSKTAVALLQEVELKAKELGCEMLQTAAHTIAKGPLMERFYRMKGYKQVETIFRKEL